MSRLGERAEVVDLRELGPAVRYIPTKQAEAGLEAAVSSRDRRWLSLTGSGDFHHVTAPILRQISEPISLVVFDYHSDWIKSSPCPCGAWMVSALGLPNIERIVSIGMGGSSIENWLVGHGPAANIFSGRVEFYPYDCKMSKCLGRRTGDPACAEIKRRLISTEIHWNTIDGSDWDSMIRRIIDSLPTEKVYLSIDKDCLRAEHAVSNWQPGHLTLDQVIGAVGMLIESRDVIGADITGEYSKIEVANRMFEKLAVGIHPKNPPPSPGDLVRNEETNLALVEAMGF